MKILAAYSIKGGVGKTAFAVNFAHACALAGKRTLLLDLDPQGASSFYFRAQPPAKLKGRQLMAGKQPLLKFVHETEYPGLDILPATLSFRHFDDVLSKAGKPGRQLRQVLKPLAKTYEVAILDAPPNLNIFSESVMQAAEFIACPVVPTPLSANTLEQLVQFLDQRFAEHAPEFLPFFSMVEARKRIHQNTISELRAQYPAMLRATIPYSTDVERMGLTRAPLLAKRPNCPAGRAFAQLAGEVLRAMT